MLAALMLLTLLVYWPALYGGYLFDDFTSVVNNTDVHITTLHLGDWIRAALSEAGTNQFRALGMLSFAANYYFTGLDPFWLKLTNVGIHLLNGLLLFLMLRELFRLRVLTRSRGGPALDEARFDLIVAVIAGAWLLLPINLTAVAYVSQRLESLANVFVFLGLFWYLRARRRHYAGHGSGAQLWISLVVCTALGFSAKEDAVLLPLYTACVEFAITGFRNQGGRFSRPALWTHAVVLILPLIAGLIWISTWVFHSIAGFRAFSIGERLLSEPRVLVDYIGWTLLPNLNSLTFYHDDLAISHGLFDPPTTLWAILALLALLGVALWQRRTRPLFCLGILWFFAGHSMTATVIPLELVFEHRNYFPSMGLLLAAASLLALEPGLRLPAAKVLVATSFIAFFAFTTFLRAEEWSNPLRLAYSEALKRPDSPRAQYELANTLVIAAGNDEKSPLIDESIKILERNAYRPNSGIAPLQALIFINGRAHRDIDPRWWQAIIEKLHDRAPSQTDIGAISFLFHCQLRGDCPVQKQELLDVFTTALTKSQGDVYLMSAYADFALTELGDAALSERMFRDVVEAKPQVPVYRSNLVRFLIATRQFDAAETAISELAPLNHLGSLDAMIAELKTTLAAAKVAPTAPPTKTHVPGSRSNQ
ncbi:MAG: tetratricopeptide repeat protein [Rudaea sp.]